jgi:hypothetical protein
MVISTAKVMSGLAGLLFAMVLCLAGTRTVGRREGASAREASVREANRARRANDANDANDANGFDATATIDVGHGRRVRLRLELDGARQRSADEGE